MEEEFDITRGTEVLIKVVACAIPTYTMQCFKVPKKVCDECNYGKVFMGATIGWVEDSLGKLVESNKQKREMRYYFKDLNFFNIALLAKQCWRILNNLEALLTKASWAWASILKGRDFIKEYVLWQIMDGKDVNIWKDRWIPKISMPCPNDEEHVVP